MENPLEVVWSWPDVDPASIEPTSVTISREPCGRWYVSFAVDIVAPDPAPPAGAAVGVDLGVKHFAVTSDGEKIANPRHLARRERNLARYQRRMARDLNVTGMVRNRRLAKAISDCGWGELRRQLEYKAARRGRRLVVIDRWYPSSKACSACGHHLAELSLSVRAGCCPSCRTLHDRDVNAAKNILAAGHAVAAGGGGIRHPRSSRMQSPAKQQPQLVRVGILALQNGE